MKRLIFPTLVMAILAAGVMFGNARAARTGISEEALLRSGHTVDRQCGAAVTGSPTTVGEPQQLAAAPIKCEEFSDGSCVAPGSTCGHTTKKSVGLCTTVVNKHKGASCACVN